MENSNEVDTGHKSRLSEEDKKEIKNSWTDVKDSFKTVFGSLIVFFVNALVVMLAWNAIIPDLFGLASLTYLQAACLELITGCLFDKN